MKFRTALIRFSDIILRSRVDPFPVTGSNLVGVDLSFRSLTYPSSIQSFSSFVPKLGLSLLNGLFRSPIRIVPSPFAMAYFTLYISLCHTLLALS